MNKKIIINYLYILGDKDYGIPPLDPFKIKLVTLNPSSSLSIILKNVVMHGLSDTTFKTVKSVF